MKHFKHLSALASLMAVTPSFAFTHVNTTSTEFHTGWIGSVATGISINDPISGTALGTQYFFSEPGFKIIFQHEIVQEVSPFTTFSNIYQSARHVNLTWASETPQSAAVRAWVKGGSILQVGPANSVNPYPFTAEAGLLLKDNALSMTDLIGFNKLGDTNGSVYDEGEGYEEWMVFIPVNCTTSDGEGGYTGTTTWYMASNFSSVQNAHVDAGDPQLLLKTYLWHFYQLELEDLSGSRPTPSDPPEGLVEELDVTSSGELNRDFSGYSAIGAYRTPNTTTVVARTLIDPENGPAVATPGPGTYDFSIKPKGCLRETVEVTVTSSSASFDPIVLRHGDINEDNEVDLLDYFLLSDSYDKTDADPDWLEPNSEGIAPEACDLNGDGSVDLLDYFLQSDSYGQSGDV